MSDADQEPQVEEQQQGGEAMETEQPQRQEEDRPAETQQTTADTEPPPQETADVEQTQGGEGEGEREGEAKEGGGEPEAAGEGEGEGEVAPAEGATQAESAPEPQEEEKVTISHEDNPNWLSAEECAARGISEENISTFQNLYFQHAYNIRTWYDSLTEHTFTTKFITLTSEEVSVVVASCHPGQSERPQLGEEQQTQLQQLEQKLSEAMEEFGSDGAFIRINDWHPTDSILERSDPEYVAKVRDAVINELEVEKQSANAYLLWRDQDRHEGAFRRGMSKIRQSFRRSRPVSTTATPRKDSDEQPKLEDATDGEKQEGEQTEQTEQTADSTATPAEGEGEEKKENVTVDVEVNIEGGGEEPKESTTQPETEEQTTTETPAEPEPEQKQEEAEAPKAEGEGEGKEEGEGQEEIQKAPEQSEEDAIKPVIKQRKEDSPHVRKAKAENLDNEILRAFGRAVTNLKKVSSGREALDMILRSETTKQYLQQLKSFGEVEGLTVTISVSRFHADIARYPGMVLRGFVYEGELTAISQKHDDITYFPDVAQYKNIVQHKVKHFHSQQLKEALAERGSYIVDLFVATEKVYILRLSPFYTGIGACLYTWAKHARLLTQGPFQFQIVDSPRKAPGLYSSLQAHWSSMLDSVLQQVHGERNAGKKTCTIL